MKKQTKQQKMNDLYTAYKCIQAGAAVKRDGAKDGSIATHPVVPVLPFPEKTVVATCISWLRKHNIFCSRHDSGTFQNIRGQWGSYGIRNSGDIHGILHSGIHFEIECKRGKGGRLSSGQQKRMREVQETKGVYLVIHGLEELEYYKELLL